MNKTVTNFYNKENNLEYYKKYNREHSPRLDFTVSYFKLNEIKNKTVADFGCGAGFTLCRLDESNKKYGFDGAIIPPENLLCPFRYIQINLDDDWERNSQIYLKKNCNSLENTFDVSFCLETLEHLASPYNALANIKKFTKENAPIYLTIPAEETWHNTAYSPLFFPRTNFTSWLDEMATPVRDYVKFNGDWKHELFLCENLPWSQKKLKYPKTEEKFRNCTLLEATNL